MLEVLIKILEFLMKKDFKWLLPAKKLLTALIELFGGDTGKVVDKLHGFVNDIVKKVEGIDVATKIYAEKKLEIDYSIIIKDSDECYPIIKITEGQYDEIKKLQDLNFVILNSNDAEEVAKAVIKKMGVKFDLAFELVTLYAKEHGLEFTFQAIRFMIEFAVSRYFTKSIK